VIFDFSLYEENLSGSISFTFSFKLRFGGIGKNRPDFIPEITA
jgi:hypothetical protein